MEYRSQELLTQEGMEESLKKFADLLAYGQPDAFSAYIPPKFYRCNFEENTMVYVYDTEPKLSNPAGAVHGGALATMIDTSMGAMIYYMAGEKITPTISMKVDYVAPGVIGRPVYVGVKVTRCGKTMAYITCKAWQTDEDKPIVTADAVYFTGGPETDLVIG
jgi:uncharacterized protein (TIGR00369 family)